MSAARLPSSRELGPAAVVDTGTGEVVAMIGPDGVVTDAAGAVIGEYVAHQPRRAPRRDPEFVQVEARAFAELDTLVDEAPASCRLLLWLIRHMGRTGELQASCAYIARALGVSERTVRRATADLRDRGLITTVRTAGGGCLHYAVDPRVAWTADRGRRTWGLRRYRGSGLWAAGPDPWTCPADEVESVPLYHRAVAPKGGTEE